MPQKYALIRRCALPRSFSSCFQQNTALLTAVRRWWSQAASHRRKAPFLDISFNKNKTALAKIDMYGARTVGTDGWKEVLCLEPMSNVVKFLAIAGEEYTAGSGTVADPNHIALHEVGTIIGWVEGLIIPAMTSRYVGYGAFVPT